MRKKKKLPRNVIPVKTEIHFMDPRPSTSLGACFRGDDKLDKACHLPLCSQG